MSTLVDTVASWLEAVDKGDWQTVWSLYAPEALMLMGPFVLPRQDVPQATYAAFQRQLTGMLAGVPQPAFTLESAEAGDGSDVQAQLWDRTSDRRFTAGFHLGAGGIAGVTVDAPLTASIAREAAGDLARLPSTTAGTHAYLTALHHAYARRLQGIPLPIRVLDEARFTCQGRGDCCLSATLSADVNSGQWLAVERLAQVAGIPPLRLKDGLLTPSLNDQQALSAKHFLCAGSGDHCHQLAGDGTCQLHASLGWQPVPTCDVYPFRAVRTPDSFDVTTSFACKTVGLNQGELLTEQTEELRRRFWQFQHVTVSIGETVPLSQSSEETVPWPTYRAWETDLLALLSSVDSSGSQALMAGTMKLSGWMGRHQSTAPQAADSLMALVLNPDEPAAWDDGWLGGRSRKAYDHGCYEGATFVPVGDVLSRYLRSVLFRKMGLQHSVGLPWFTTLMAHRMVKVDARFRAWRAGRKETDADDLLSAIRATEYYIGHQDLANQLFALPGQPGECFGTWFDLCQ